MDSFIPISTINDFLYCPKSLYLHSIYSSFDTDIYHDAPQTKGSAAHANIEGAGYSTSVHVLQGISVCSMRLGIKGKIDIYDMKNHWLIERKYKVKNIYTGYKYQLYAQMFCMEECNYQIEKLFIQSLSDNRRYEIPLPNREEKSVFESVIQQMKNFTSQDLEKHHCTRCENNIYDLLSW